MVSSWHSDRVAHGRTAAAPLLNDHVGNVYFFWGGGRYMGGGYVGGGSMSKRVCESIGPNIKLQMRIDRIRDKD